MNRASFLGSGWARSGGSNTGVVRRACPASGAQWNVQVVRGRVNGKCLWNACKALSLGLLLMVLGAAMATIGYFADHLSVAQEIRGNSTVKIKNESRGFHLNNLSYAGPIVMGVGGFIVVAACVMTFEARDSAAKVVPARLKVNSGSSVGGGPFCGRSSSYIEHSTLRTSGSQTMATQYHGLRQTSSFHHHDAERRALTQSFQQFSRGLILNPNSNHQANNKQKTNRIMMQQQFSVNKSPSAPNLVQELEGGICDTSLIGGKKVKGDSSLKRSPLVLHTRQLLPHPSGNVLGGNRRNLPNCSSPHLRPKFNRHALSVDETAKSFRNDLQSDEGSQCSMALDLHLECPVTLRVRDRRRNPLCRQQKVEEAEDHITSRKSSRSCSPRLPSRHNNNNVVDCAITGGSANQLPMISTPRRRNSNSSECNHRSRSCKRDFSYKRARLERAISSDSRLTKKCQNRHWNCSHSRYYTSQTSSEQEQGESKSDTDLHNSHSMLTRVSVHKS